MSPQARKRNENRSSKPGRKRRRRKGGGGNRGRRDGAGFWGAQEKLPGTRPEVRITDDPAAVVRSLGPAPLPGHETIAEHYFAAVYDRAVTLAGALAAAGGLVQLEELSDETTEDGG